MRLAAAIVVIAAALWLAGPAMAAAPTDPELLFWQSIKDSRNLAEFEAYLAKFPDGTFSELARIRASRLRLGAGLEIRNMRTAREFQDGADVIVVRGVVHNLSTEMRPVPFIRVTLHDGGGDVVRSQVLAPDKVDLAPGEDFAFRALFKNPPGSARRAGVDWTEMGPPAALDAGRK